jgi:hypothetical protein
MPDLFDIDPKLGQVNDVKDLERYPRDRRTIRWRGEYVVAAFCIAVVVFAYFFAR